MTSETMYICRMIDINDSNFKLFVLKKALCTYEDGDRHDVRDARRTNDDGKSRWNFRS